MGKHLTEEERQRRNAEFEELLSNPEVKNYIYGEDGNKDFSILDWDDYADFEEQLVEKMKEKASEDKEYDVYDARDFLNYIEEKRQKEETLPENSQNQLFKDFETSVLNVFRMEFSDPEPGDDEERNMEILDRKYEQLQDTSSLSMNAELVAKTIKHANSADVMKYVLCKQHEIIEKYENKLGPDKIKTLANYDEKITSPSSIKSIKYNICKRHLDDVKLQNQRDAARRKFSADVQTQGPKLKNLATKLENAKTFFNSDEYKNIIKTARAMSEPIDIPGTENLTPYQKEATKLFTIKRSIDAYLNHKAKDGVNQSVYKKLAAVEELNTYVSQRIKQLVSQEFVAGRDTLKPQDVYVKYEEYVESRPADQIARYKSYSAAINHLDDSVKAAERKGFTVNKNEFANVQDCMGRIISRALDRNRDITNLVKQQAAFKDKPNTSGKPDKKPEMVPGK